MRRTCLMCVLLLLVGSAFAALMLAGCGRQGDQTDRDASTGSAPAATVGAVTTVSPFDTIRDATTTTSAALPSTTTSELSVVDSVLERMTLEEKVAQVMLVTFQGTGISPEMAERLREHPPGGLLLMSGNITGPAQLTALTDQAQKTAATGSGVGLFIAVDQEGGPVQRIREGAPAVPSARALGDGATPAEAGLLAEATGLALTALGVNMDLAPVADVVGESASFLYKRTYSQDPLRVSEFVTAVIAGLKRGGVISVVKHFPGHGSAAGDTHTEVVTSAASATELWSTHLPPFEAAIDAGVEGVMMAHVVSEALDPGVPASLSLKVVTGLLRDRLGFTGLVVTDDLRMAGASDSARGPGEAAVAALRAGCDLLISTGTAESQLAIADAVAEAVRDGSLPSDKLDEAVRRVLVLKLANGLISAFD